MAELARLPPPPASVGWQIRDLARIALTIGAVLLTLIPIALQYFGSAWNADRELPTVQAPSPEIEVAAFARTRAARTLASAATTSADTETNS